MSHAVENVKDDFGPMRGSQSTAFGTKAARLHSPKYQRLNSEAMKFGVKEIGRALANQKVDPKLLREYTEECFAFAFYAGIRRGYDLRDEIDVRKSLKPQEDRILAFLAYDRDLYPTGKGRLELSASQLTSMMDERGIPPPKRKWAKPGARWTDLFRNPRRRGAVETYLTRMKKDARKLRIAEQWATVLRRGKRHSKATKKSASNKKPPTP